MVQVGSNLLQFGVRLEVLDGGGARENGLALVVVVLVGGGCLEGLLSQSLVVGVVSCLGHK